MKRNSSIGLRPVTTIERNLYQVSVFLFQFRKVAFEQCAANELSTPVYDHRFNLRDFLLAEISIRIHEILWKCDQSNRNGLGKKT